MTLTPALPLMRVGVFVAAQTDRCRRGPIGGPEHLDLRTGGEAIAHAGQDLVGALVADLDDLVGPIVDVVGVAAGAAQHPIGAGAAIERVVPVEAAQHVRAVHAHELVDAVISPQDVGVDRAGEVFDADEGVAFGVAVGSLVAKQGNHALGRLIVRDRIDPLVAVEPVGTAAAFERVVARSALQHVVPSRPSRKSSPANPSSRVVAIVADERVRE